MIYAIVPKNGTMPAYVHKKIALAVEWRRKCSSMQFRDEAMDMIRCRIGRRDGIGRDILCERRNGRANCFGECRVLEAWTSLVPEPAGQLRLQPGRRVQGVVHGGGEDCLGKEGSYFLRENIGILGKDTQGRGRGHGGREKAGTGAERCVRWAGAGFPWKFGEAGAQRGEVRGKRPGGAVSGRIRGVSEVAEGFY